MLALEEKVTVPMGNNFAELFSSPNLDIFLAEVLTVLISPIGGRSDGLNHVISSVQYSVT